MLHIVTTLLLTLVTIGSPMHASDAQAQENARMKAELVNFGKGALDIARRGLSSITKGESDAVRTGDTLSKNEQTFLQKRGAITKQAIKALFPELNLKDDEIPTIAFVGTGGGCRAMIQAAGALAAAEETGLLKTFSYMGGLSGSTWYINPLVASGVQPRAYIDLLIQNLQDAPSGRDPILGIRIPSKDEIFELGKTLTMKKVYNQPINIMDIYGFLLANEFLANMSLSKQSYKYSDLQKNLSNGQYPLPVSTALEVTESPTTKWFECTPYDIGCFHEGMKAAIPAWAFGRTYANGKSTNAPSEITLGYAMGIFGSAFAVDCWEIMSMVVKKLRAILPDEVWAGLDKGLAILEQKIKDPAVQAAHRDFLLELDAFTDKGTDRPDQVIRQYTAGKADNFTKGMSNQRMAQHQHVLLVDGGHDSEKLPFKDGWGIVNFGAIPLLRPARKVDVLVMCDATLNIADKGPVALGALETRARAEKLPFPTISTEEYLNAAQQKATVFGAQQANAPTIVYLPGLLDQETAQKSNTLTFKYSPEHVRTITNTVGNDFKASTDVIKQAIYDAIMKKRAALGR